MKRALSDTSLASAEELEERIRKRTLLYVTYFMLVIYIISTLFGIRGLHGVRPPEVEILTLLRILFTSALALNLMVIRRNRLKAATSFLLAVQGISLFSGALLISSPFAVNLFSLVTVGVFTLQLLALFMREPVLIISGGCATIAAIFIAGFRYLSILPEDQHFEVVIALVIATFLLIMVIFGSSLNTANWARFLRYLRRLAYIDSDTGLPNLKQLNEDFRTKLIGNQASFKQQVILGFRLLGMGKIEAKYSYGSRNHALTLVAERMHTLHVRYKLYALTHQDFAMVPLRSYTPDEDNMLLREFNRVFGKPFTIGGTEFKLSYALAGTVYPHDGTSAEKLVANLQNIFSTQAQNTIEIIRWYDPHYFSQMRRRLQIEDEIPAALEREEFFFLLQPKYDLRTKMIIGAEALARWKHPVLGDISPTEFIPLVESSGYMDAFSSRLLQLAKSHLQILHQQKLSGLSIAVNLSASSLHNSELILELMERRSESQTKIEIEITEDLFLSIDEKILETLHRLKKNGFTVAMDDFGTGFSNLEYLQRLDIDVLKIDKRFIDPICEEKRSREIVRAIIQMGRAFGVEVVAEGVETENQFARLKELGVDIIQGYYIARPMPFEEYLLYLRKRISVE